MKKLILKEFLNSLLHLLFPWTQAIEVDGELGPRGRQKRLLRIIEEELADYVGSAIVVHGRGASDRSSWSKDLFHISFFSGSCRCSSGIPVLDHDGRGACLDGNELHLPEPDLLTRGGIDEERLRWLLSTCVVELGLDSLLDSLVSSYRVSSPIQGGGSGSLSIDESRLQLLSLRAAKIQRELIKAILGPLTRRDIIVHFYEEGFRAGPVLDEFSHVHVYSSGPSRRIAISGGHPHGNLEMEPTPFSVLIKNREGRILGEVMERNLFIYAPSSGPWRGTASEAVSLARLLNCCAEQILRTRLSRIDREQCVSDLALDCFNYLSGLSPSGSRLPEYWRSWSEQYQDWQAFHARFRKAYFRVCELENVIRVVPGYGNIMVVTDSISPYSTNAGRYLILFDLLCPSQFPRIFRSVPGSTLEHEFLFDHGSGENAELGRLIAEISDAFKAET